MGKTLADFLVGEWGMVTGFTGDAGRCRQKLLAMGLIRGTRFEVVRVAPMGDPMEIRVKGFSLSLRKAEAETLQAEGAAS